MLGMFNLLSLTLQHYIFLSMLVFFSGGAIIFLSKNHEGIFLGLLGSFYGLFFLASSFFLFTKAYVFLIFIFFLPICIFFLLKHQGRYKIIISELEFFQKLSMRFLVFLSVFLIFELLF
jgi:hypothetical protein